MTRFLYPASLGPAPFDGIADTALPDQDPSAWTPSGNAYGFQGANGKGKKDKPGKWKEKDGFSLFNAGAPMSGPQPPLGPFGTPPQYEGVAFPWKPYYQFQPPRRMPIQPIETRSAPLHTRPIFKWDWDTVKNVVLPQENLWRWQTYAGIEWQSSFEETVNPDKYTVYWKMPDQLPRLPIFNQQDEEFDLTQLEQVTLDKWFSQPALPQVRPYVVQVQQWEDMQELLVLEETITVDKWYSSWQIPVRRSAQIVARSAQINPEPLPDEDLTAYMIWQAGIGLPIDQRIIPWRPITNGILHPEELDETVSVSVFDRMSLPGPAAPGPLDRQHRAWEQPIDLEDITIDKFYSPLGYEFRTPPAVIPLSTELVPPGDLEAITVDKWYSPLGLPVLPEERPVQRLYPMDPEPVPPVPGYDEFWTGSVAVVYQQPVLGTLYYAHQDLNHERPVTAVPRPVRRRIP